MGRSRSTIKRTFLLMEVLIALSLLGLVLYLVIYPYCACDQKEKKLLARMQEERMADLACLEICQDLLEDKTPKRGSYVVEEEGLVRICIQGTGGHVYEYVRNTLLPS